MYLPCSMQEFAFVCLITSFYMCHANDSHTSSPKIQSTFRLEHSKNHCALPQLARSINFYTERSKFPTEVKHPSHCLRSPSLTLPLLSLFLCLININTLLAQTSTRFLHEHRIHLLTQCQANALLTQPTMALTAKDQRWSKMKISPSSK
jgi:hypothetical protein